jgi:hypothetical protein
MNVALQLLVSLALFIACAMIHGTGLVLASRLLDVEDKELERRSLAMREVGIMVPMVLCLFVMHVIEVFVFAGFYMAANLSDALEPALFVSVTAYTTLGIAEGAPGVWRLVYAFEGLTGFVMIGWSAAIILNDMDRVLRRRF